MKAKIKSNEINKAIKSCVNAIDVKDMVRSNIAFEAENGKITLKATNGLYSVQTECTAEVMEEGVAIVDGKMAYNAISKSNGDCLLTSDEKNMTIKTSGRTKFPNVNHELPMIADAEGKEIRVDAVAFKNAIGKTSYAISEDQSRLVLTGAHVVSDSSNVVITTLDGFRLAETAIDCEGDNVDMIVPSRILNAVCDAVTSGTLTIRTNGMHITFIGEGFKINAVLLSGNYIDTSRIVPTKFEIKVLTNTVDLRNCLDSATIASGSSNLVKLSIHNDSITIMSNSGEADFQGDVNAFVEGEALEIAFNLKYIIQAINHIETEQCEILMSTSTSPAVIFPHEEEKTCDKHLLLPVRLFN